MARPTKHQVRYRNVGRPEKIDETVLAKLEDAFRNAFTDEMACLFAGISEATLNRYCQKNPEFRVRKEKLKISPNLRAQAKLVADIENVSGARYWAERRMKDFMPKQTVVLDGKVDVEDTEMRQTFKEVTEKYEEELKRKIAEMHKKP